MLFFSNLNYVSKAELKRALINVSYTSLFFLSLLPLAMRLNDSSTPEGGGSSAGLDKMGMCPLGSNSTALSMISTDGGYAATALSQLSSALMSTLMCAIPLSRVLESSFSFPGVEERKIIQPNWESSKDFLTRDFTRTYGSAEFLFTSLPNNTLRRPIDNGLIATMLEAYNNHVPLVLRPDDVWLTIVSAFGHFIHKNGLENTNLTSQLFVSVEEGNKLIAGKKLISVEEVGSFKTSTEADWMRFVAKMVREMDRHLHPNMTKWIVPNFSTSSKQDQFISRIMLMGAMQNYFEYQGSYSCGLPKVTLLGSLQDWIALREKASILSSFGGMLEKWADLLLPVLDQFIISYQGKADQQFWQRIASGEGYSCGSVRLKGWAAVFSPFNRKGDYHLSEQKNVGESYSKADMEDFIDATMQVPVQIVENDASFQVFLRAGMMNPQYDAEKNVMRPTTGWAMVKKP